MLVKQILGGKANGDIHWVTGGSLVSEAVKTLSDKRIGTVVVSADGKTPEGILSERDIVREIGKRGATCLTDAVSTMMTPKPITCTPSDDANGVLETMTSGRFRHMPVMESGALIGLISIGDVVKARLAELAMEKTALEDMVMGR